MMIDSDKLIRILEGLKEQTTGKVVVLKEPAVYGRIIELIKHIERGVEPVSEDHDDYEVWHCPVCGHHLFETDDRCQGCGSKINWG